MAFRAGHISRRRRVRATAKATLLQRELRLWTTDCSRLQIGFCSERANTAGHRTASSRSFRLVSSFSLPHADPSVCKGAWENRTRCSRYTAYIAFALVSVLFSNRGQRTEATMFRAMARKASASGKPISMSGKNKLSSRCADSGTVDRK